MSSNRIEPQDGDTGLASHPHRHTLRGDPGSLRYPPLCANCGGPESHRIRCTKVFRRTHGDDPTTYVTAHADVPFCAACANRHAAQSQPRTWWADVLSSFSTADMFGAVMPAIAAAFVVWLALKDAVAGHGVRVPWLLAIAAVFGLIAWLQRRHVWDATRHLRVPPQTDVARAFDFSDDVSGAFEPPRFVCTMRDARFADALLQLNADRVWVATSPQAVAEKRRAERRMWAVGGVVLLLFLASLVWDWIR